MIARPRRLALITTRRCTAACEHCCFGCSPRASDSIPVRRLHELIDEASQIETIGDIGFTGGECFLLGKELDQLVARAAGHGFFVSCITNGYWATDARVAESRLKRLAAAGLGSLTISTGTFHQRFVPLERVITAATAATALFPATRISVESCEQTAFDSDVLRDDLRLRGAVDSGRLRVDDNIWVESIHPGATRITNERSLSVFEPKNLRRCDSVLDVLSVAPDQTLYACCGLTMEAIPELALGSIEHRTIGQVLSAAEDDLLKLWIHVAGPERILAFVKERDPSYALPLESAHMCTTCLHLHRDERARAVLQKHAHEVEAAVVTAYLDLERSKPAPRRQAP